MTDPDGHSPIGRWCPLPDYLSGQKLPEKIKQRSVPSLKPHSSLLLPYCLILKGLCKLVADFKHQMDIKVEATQLERVTTRPDEARTDEIEVSETLSPDASYAISARTYLVLIVMGITWGTCTMANIGPSTTLSYAVNALGGSSISSWIPNAALIPLIGLQPVWVGYQQLGLTTDVGIFMLTSTRAHWRTALVRDGSSLLAECSASWEMSCQVLQSLLRVSLLVRQSLVLLRPSL